MTVREYAKASKYSIWLKVAKDGAIIVRFESLYWEYIIDDILDSEIDTFEIESAMMKKPEVTLNLADDTDIEPGSEEEPEPDDGDEEEDPDDEEGG